MSKETSLEDHGCIPNSCRKQFKAYHTMPLAYDEWGYRAFLEPSTLENIARNELEHQTGVRQAAVVEGVGK